MRMLTLTAVIAVVAAIATPTWAQDNFPTKPIRTVVPFEAGGDSDLEARLAGEYLEKILGQPMNLTFMPGGANIPGVMEVLKAAADGYTLLWWATPAIAINPVRKPGPYSAEDLQPIATTTDNPVMLFVKKDSQITDLNTFLEAVRSNNLTMGVNIIGSVPHMAAAELAQAAGVDFRYITQKTNPGSVIALMGGHVDAAMGLGPQMIAYGDDIRAIATFAAERNPSFPDVPTTTEQGYDISAFALSGPAVKKGTPQEIVDRLEAAFMEVLANPEYQAEAKRRGQFIASERQWSREATEASWADSVTSYTAMLNQLGLIE